MTKLIDLTGKQFGRLTVMCRSKSKKPGNAQWQCLCVCGRKTIVRGNTLVGGRTKSCGCLSAELKRKRKTRLSHGMSFSKEYGTWRRIMRRCYEPTYPHYKNYGGRGICVDKRWHVFESFFSDIGVAPSKNHSIDRIDPNGPYSKSNCRWATSKEQARNTTKTIWLTANGRTKTLQDWCDEIGILTPAAIMYRIRKFGWSHEKALFTKPMRNRHEHKQASLKARG